MTENEARLMLNRSQSDTAFKLALHYGLPMAREFTARWIKVLANLKRIPTLTLEFWCDVAMRLKGHRPLEGCCLPGLSAFERAHYGLMFSRVGMKGSHYNEIVARPLNKAAKALSGSNSRETTCHSV